MDLLGCPRHPPAGAGASDARILAQKLRQSLRKGRVMADSGDSPGRLHLFRLPRKDHQGGACGRGRKKRAGAGGHDAARQPRSGEAWRHFLCKRGRHPHHRRGLPHSGGAGADGFHHPAGALVRGVSPERSGDVSGPGQGHGAGLLPLRSLRRERRGAGKKKACHFLRERRLEGRNADRRGGYALLLHAALSARKGQLHAGSACLRLGMRGRRGLRGGGR